MKRNILALTLATLLLGNAYAEQITLTQAEQIAAQFLNNKRPKRAPASTDTPRLTLAYQAQTGMQTDFYVFNQGENQGYILVAATDQVQPVIGYTDSGTFRYDRISENMRWWLNQYQREINYLKTHPNTKTAEARQTTPVTPLLATTWGQETPFNLYAPQYTTSRADDNVPPNITFVDVNSAAGCVAIGMSQIMKYHRWPERGKGSITYTFLLDNNFFNRVQLSANFDHAYDWDNMLAHYDTTTVIPEAAQQAVAQLAFDAGAAARTGYGSVSGASMIYAANALVSNFSYSPAMKYARRESNELDSWLNRIHNELNAQRPVLYGGSSESYGHAFVIDGCDDQGRFHINWGWYGDLNGYFALSLLNPETGQNYEAGFNFGQEAIFNIQPDNGETLQPEVEGYYNSISFSKNSDIPVDSAIKYTFNGLDFVGHGYGSLVADSVKLYVGFQVLRDDNQQTVYTLFNDLTAVGVEMNNSYNVSPSMRIPAAIPDGNYRLVPIFQIKDDQTRTFHKPLNTLGYYNLNIKHRRCNISEARPDFNLTLDNLSVEEQIIYSDYPAHIFATITNNDNNEFTGTLRYDIYQNDTLVATARQYDVVFPQNGTRELHPIFNTPTEGEYTIRLFVNDKLIGTSPAFYVGEGPSFNLRIVKSLQPEYAEMLPDSVCAIATITNTGTHAFAQPLEVLVAETKDNDNDPDVILGSIFSERVRIAKSDTTQVYFHGVVSGLEIGKTYRLIPKNPKQNYFGFGLETTFLCGMHKGAPLLQPAKDITSDAFTAQWINAINAQAYQLRLVNNITSTPIIDETFIKCTQTATSDIASTLNNYTDNTGWTGKLIFQHTGGIRLGKPGNNTYAYAYAPNNDIRNDNNRVVVRLTAATFENLNDCQLSIINTETGDADTIIVRDNTPRDYEVEITTNRKRAQRIGFRTLAGQAVVLQNVQILAGTADYTITTLQTDTTTATVANLTTGTYRYATRAIFPDNTFGGWSNVQSVTLTEHVPGDINNDNIVDIADLNAIISLILENRTNVNADLNNDGSIDIADLNAMINIILGKQP